VRLIILAALTLAGCTPVERAGAATGIGIASGVEQDACARIDGADPAAATVCGPLSEGVSIVAQLVEALLKSLPPGARQLVVADLAPRSFWITLGAHDYRVTLPAWQAAAVQAKFAAALTALPAPPSAPTSATPAQATPPSVHTYVHHKPAP
jgi:hypothetical protein